MFEGMLDKLFRRQSVPTFYGRVPEKQVLEEGHKEAPFQQENSYVTLRLASMHLKNARELWRNFMPFSVVIVDVLFDGKQTSFPFVVGNDLVQKAIHVPLGNRSIEPLNTTVAGPIPYLGGKVSVFLGLFRSTENDMSRGLFDTIGELAQLGGANQLAALLPVAEVLRKGIYRIFDMKEVEFCFGRKDELDPNSRARNQLKSGYLAFVNVPASNLAEESLWVENAILRIGTDSASAKFCSSDHCLLAVDHTTGRGHYADLEFEASWKEMQSLIWADQVQKAELFMFPELGKAIVQSPDLTPDDKTAALALYKLKMEAEIDRFNTIKGGGKTKATRGTRGLGKGLGTEPMMQKAAFIAEEATRDSVVSGLLVDLATRRAEVLQRDGEPMGGPSSDSEDLDAQIAAVRNLRPSSSGTAGVLYDALMADVMDTYTR